jgi:hypothetical protein
VRQRRFRDPWKTVSDVVLPCDALPQGHRLAFAAEVAAGASAFSWIRGEDLVTVYEAPLLREQPPYRHAFCRVCGSPLPVVLGATNFIVLHVGVLDGDVETRPFRHIFVGQNPSWHAITDAMPQFEQGPPAGQRLPRSIED